MIRASVLTLSEGVILDGISGTVSLYNVLENVQVSQLPAMMPKIGMLVMLERKESDTKTFELEAKLFCNNSNNVIQSIKTKVDFKENLRHKRIGLFRNVAIKETGELSVSLLCEGEEINRYSANIIQMPEQPAVPSKK